MPVPAYMLSTNPRSYKKNYGTVDFLWAGSNLAHEAALEDGNDVVDPPTTVQSRDTQDWHEVQSIVLSPMSQHDPDLLAEGYWRLHDLLVRRGM
ncbi:hypothetical protein LIER_26497 [Lithospermum erythrorhizon]|uniref:Uncharacterized protein n=1 Tax=Lithospermum erythrorhizon TaxID=34254 RepID=A0AAV3RCS9_LITER